MSVLVKAPDPEPSCVRVAKSEVGLAEVFQHTPLDVMFAPPSLVMLPPVTAPKDVISATWEVVSEALAARVVAETWVPYAVPASLVA